MKQDTYEDHELFSKQIINSIIRDGDTFYVAKGTKTDDMENKDILSVAAFKELPTLHASYFLTHMHNIEISRKYAIFHTVGIG